MRNLIFSFAAMFAFTPNMVAAQMTCTMDRRCPAGADCSPADLTMVLQANAQRVMLLIEGAEPARGTAHRMDKGWSINITPAKGGSEFLNISADAKASWSTQENGKLVGYFGTCEGAI